MGTNTSILKVSPAFKSSLEAIGENNQFPSAHVLFRDGDRNRGVFLVRSGKVLMSVKSMPKLDRIFSAGSVLGLPSTFTRNCYSLTAVTIAKSEVVHVPREQFMELMCQKPELCREAIDVLGPEVAFIQSALVERRLSVGRGKLSPGAIRKARPTVLGARRDAPEF
jgi:CRP-like cAMP-binding protein